ncbi:probable carboxylesterase 12 [Cucurbita moschata]|uniref:Probable carboxylesterase 12 n=1 Tax=Cucurbita moschata TaxID=3662 RepID=A0A6J1FTL3_CUCMO|nr:probable carboxylesterase 12 [Cucurbita moschata]
MASSTNDVADEFFPFLRIYKDGRIQRLQVTSDIVSACADDPNSAFRAKDVTISVDSALSVRIFIPSAVDLNQKLPLLLYVHGGAFCFESAFNLQYHRHVGSLAAKANAVAVSVEYRLAPENPIPACYDDCWDALRWIAAHVNRDGPEPWLNQHADLDRICLAGDSAGANICHHLAVRAGTSAEQLGRVKVVALALIHPFFGDGAGDRLWKYLCSDTTWLRPTAQDLATLPCRRVKIFLAEKDSLKFGGRNYDEDLKSSGWKGAVETVEHGGEDHVFHLKMPECEKAVDLMEKLSCFINLD